MPKLVDFSAGMASKRVQHNETFNFILLLVGFVLMVWGIEQISWQFGLGIMIFFIAAHTIGGLDEEANRRNDIEQERQGEKRGKRSKKIF